MADASVRHQGASSADDQSGRSDAEYLVKNETPWPMEIRAKDGGGNLCLTAFEERPMESHPEDAFMVDTLIDHKDLVVIPPGSQDEGKLFILRRVTKALRWSGSWLRRTTALIGIVLTTLVVPAVALYAGTELNDVLGDWDEARSKSGFALVGMRGLQLVWIAIVSLLPSLMYFQFDRENLASLRRRVRRHIFRLDPSLRNLSEFEDKYGGHIEAAYGKHWKTGSGQVTYGRMLPILVATLVISCGWVLVVSTTEPAEVLRNVDLARVDEGWVGTFQAIQFSKLVVPERSAVVFGFLGAYFFAIQLLWRGYVRGDLRSKMYTTITVRVFVVIILSWLLDAVTDQSNRALLAAAFMAGIVPETALRGIRDIGERVPGVDEPAPLTELEGIDLYDRTRLADEGVNNVQGMARHDFMDLIVGTRIPAARLVDWADQAILYTQVVPQVGSSEEDKKRLGHFRKFGVRTATDLLHVVKEARRRGEGQEERLLAALGRDNVEVEADPAAGKNPAPVLKMRALIDAIEDEDWLPFLRNWRYSKLAGKDGVYWYLDETGSLQRRPKVRPKDRDDKRDDPPPAETSAEEERPEQARPEQARPEEGPTVDLTGSSAGG